MLSKKDVKFLNEVSTINHEMDSLIALVNKMNISAMKIVAEKDPMNLTPDMVVALAREGIDVRDINQNLAAILPDCLVVKDEPQEENKVSKDKAFYKDISEEIQKMHNDSFKKVRGSRSVKAESIVKTTPNKTGNIIHDDDVKRGVIFAKCNKSPDIENEVVDVLQDAASDRDINIQEYIVNDKDGVEKLNTWMESGVISYILMNNLDEFSKSKTSQFYFVDHAFRQGIQILLRDNDFIPIVPF